MKKRVTITLDPDVHRLARQTARKRKTTVSGLIEALLQSETTPAKRGIVASMVGAASLRAPSPGTDALYDALQAKYLSR